MAAQKVRVHSLDDAKGLGIEARRIYRAIRHGKLNVNEGRSLIYCLKMIAEMDAQSDLEQRIERLEEDGTPLPGERRNGGRLWQ